MGIYICLTFQESNFDHVFQTQTLIKRALYSVCEMEDIGEFMHPVGVLVGDDQ